MSRKSSLQKINRRDKMHAYKIRFYLHGNYMSYWGDTDWI
jgi:hypothetical protein